MKLPLFITAVLALAAMSASAQSQIFGASSGTSCSAQFSPATAATEVTISCSESGTPSFNGRVTIAALVGSGKGVILSVNDVAMLFRRQAAADPLNYQVSVNVYDSTGKLLGNKMVAQGAVAVP